MSDRDTDRDYIFCRVNKGVVGKNENANGENSDGSRSCGRCCRTRSSCSSMAAQLSRWRSKFQDEERHKARHDAEDLAEQGCLLLQQPGAQQPEMIEQQQHDEETHTLLQLQHQKRLKLQQGVETFLIGHRSTGLLGHQDALKQHRRRHQRQPLKHHARGYDTNGEKQEKQQGIQAEEVEKQQSEEDEEESEAQEDYRQLAMHGTRVLHEMEEIAQYIPKRPVVGEYYRLRESSLVWPLQRQNELLSVELTGGCCFREAAVHGQDRKSAADLHHFQQERPHSALLTTAQSLPSLEQETRGRRTTTTVEGEGAVSNEGQGREGYVMRTGEEQAEGDERGRASFSMVLRPNVLSGFRSRSASSSLGASQFSLRSLMGGESFKRDYAAKRERGERVAAGESPRTAARQTAMPRAPATDEAIQRRDVEGEGDAVAPAGSAATDRTSFVATATDAGSVYRKSTVSTCWYWSRRIFSRSRWHYLVFLSIYAYLIGPIYLNWAPLRELLFRSGAYAWECDPNEQDPSSLRYISPGGQEDSKERKDGGGGGGSPAACTLQRLRVGNLYTVCAAADFGFSFFGGLVVDWLGPKTGSLLGSTSMLVGWLLLGLSSESVPAYLPGMVLFGIGIDMAFYGTLSVARLFPGHANIVIAAIVGMRGLGLMSPLILNAIPLSFTAVMLGYALGCLLPAVLIASVYAPWKPFQADTLQKKKRKKGAASLLPERLTGSSHALDTAAPDNHDLGASPRVAAQETAADLFCTAKAASAQRSDTGNQRQLLLDKTMQEAANRDLWQRQGQKGQQLSEPQQDDLKQRSSVVVSALSAEVAVDKKQSLQAFPGPFPEGKQPLVLHSTAVETGNEHESHPNLVYGADVEEGWLSDTGTGERETKCLFNPVPQVQQEQEGSLGKREECEEKQHVFEQEKLEEGSSVSDGGRGAGPSICWLPKHERSSTISSTGSGPNTCTLPADSFPRVRRRGDFSSDVNLSLAPARAPMDTAVGAASSVAPRTRVALADGGSPAGAPCGMTRDVDELGMPKQRQIEVEERKLGKGRASVLLQQQQAHSMELTGTPRTQHQATQVQHAEEAWTKSNGSDRVEGQPEQADVFPENSLVDSEGRLPQLFASRRTQSAAADEESTSAWAFVDASADAAEESIAAANREQEEHHVEDARGSDSNINKGPEMRRVGATASCPAASTETPGNSTTAAAGESTELLKAVDLKEGVTTTGRQGSQDMHASTSLEKHIPLRRLVSSRQFPRSFRGRMQYIVAYVRNHPWTVSSVAFLRDYLFTLVYLPVVPYFAFCLMRSVYFSDASEDLVPSAIGTLHVLLACVCVVPPITGLLADLWSIMPCIVLINTTGTLVMLGSLLAHLTHIVAFEYVAVVSYMPFAAVLTNQVYFYVADAFPQRHLGKLCGFACSVGGVVSLSVTSMFEFSVKTKGGFTILLSIMLGISGLCYGFIFLLYIGQKRLKRRNAEAAAAAAALDITAVQASQTLLPCASTAAFAVVTTAAAPGGADRERAAAVAVKEDRVPAGGSAVPTKFSELEDVRAEDHWSAEESLGENLDVAAARKIVSAGVGH